MHERNQDALKKANEMSIAVQSYLENGNMEMAHRAAGIYQSIMLAILVTELVPGAQDLLDEISNRPIKSADGTIIQ